MGVARKTPEQLEAAWTAAYDLRLDGMSLDEIAAALKGAPHFCGGKTTARTWVEEGHKLAAASDDPLRSRRARREMSLDAIDKLRVKIAIDTAKGLMPLRAAGYRLQLEAIRLSTQIAGAQAPRELPTVENPDGSERPATLGELNAALAEIPVDELLEAFGTLPDGRTQP